MQCKLSSLNLHQHSLSLSLCFSLTWQESTLQIARDAWGIKHRRMQHAKREKALALALCRRS